MPVLRPFAAVAIFLCCGLPFSAQAAGPTPEEINGAEYSGGELPDGQSALTARLQVLLDRHDASPGVIDGYNGENVGKAIFGVEKAFGVDADGTMDQDLWDRIAADASPVMIRHTISKDDASRIVDALPDDYAKLAERDWLGFTSVAEKIAERFHMDLDFLKALNPGVDFAKTGTEIWVADPGEASDAKVTRIVASTSRQQVLAYDGSGQLVSSYPATVGSEQNPSPSGTYEVQSIAVEATYTYLPEENFTQSDNTEKLVLPPGPNGPVGLVWIDLSKPTFGIHGTAEPSEIDKTASHGCIRLTNWDAMELAEMVSVGATVAFED